MRASIHRPVVRSNGYFMITRPALYRLLDRTSTLVEGQDSYVPYRTAGTFGRAPHVYALISMQGCFLRLLSSSVQIGRYFCRTECRTTPLL